MPKLPKRKNLKPAGKCIFCGGGAVPGNPMTGEHLWSNWMAKANLLPRVSNQYIETATKERRYTGEASNVQRYREGAPNQKKIKVVCKKCNSGWMNALETEVQPILAPLIKERKIILDRKKRKTLAEWIVLKMLVAEHTAYRNHAPDPLYTKDDRNAFMLRRIIPQGIRIYLVRQRGLKWATGYNRRASGIGDGPPLHPLQKDPTGTKNVQAITWGLGALLIYISAITDAEIRPIFRFVKMPEFRRLWPLTVSDLDWPPPYRVNDGFIDDLAGALGRYLDANMR